MAGRPHGALEQRGTDLRIALIRDSPVEDTLTGERLEIYPLPGSYLLAEAIDRAGADLVLHGTAHGGVEEGMTLRETTSAASPGR